MLPEEINLPQTVTIFESEHPSPVSRDELKETLNIPNLRFLMEGPAIIIINDHHRSTPSGRILQLLVELYGDIANIDYIVIAGGTHEEPTDEQLTKLTAMTEEKFDAEILLHDPIGEEIELVYIGTTSRGTEVKILPILLDYDKIICINSVEPHYFAGFTGGVKSIIPGLAAKSTVEKNHAWALSPDSGPTLTQDNPLPLDLWEGFSLLKKDIYGIQLVNFQQDIFDLTVGPLREAFESAKLTSYQIYSRQINEKFDVIVSIVYPPLDKSLYQAQKGIENTRQALKDGGEMILVASCHDGIGNSAFYEKLSQFSSPEEVMDAISIENYQFGDHKSFKFASLAKKSKITIVGELDKNQAARVFADVISLYALESKLSQLARENKSIALVLDSGALTLSYNPE